jgi:hypothetical protein
LKFRSHLATMAAAALCVLSFAALGQAASIAISDPSFETPVLSGVGSFTNLSGTGWTSTGGSPVIDFAGTNQFVSLPDGNQVAILDDFNGPGTLSQTLAATLSANTTYTLTFWVGNDLLLPYSGYTAALTAGGVTLAGDNSAVSPTAGHFLQDTITFSSGASPAQLGQALGITLSDVGFNAVAFDEFQLDGSPTTVGAAPEPQTWMLLGGGLLLLVWLRRGRLIQKTDAPLQS